MYDVRADGLQEFLSQALDWYEPGAGKSDRFLARSCGGFEFTHETEITGDPRGMNRAFVEAMREEGKGGQESARR